MSAYRTPSPLAPRKPLPHTALYLANFPKYCSCRIAYTAEGWEKLHYVGEHSDSVERLELRTCRVCHSTIAIVIGLGDIALSVLGGGES